MREIGLVTVWAPRPPGSVWSRLSTLAVVSLVVVCLRVVGFSDALSPSGFVGLVLEGYFIALPVLAAVAVGLLEIRDRRHIGGVIASVTLVMLLLDFAPQHPGRASSRELSLAPSGTAVERVAPPRWSEPGALERVFRCEAAGGCLNEFRGEGGGVQREGLPYGVAYFKVFFLLAPLIVVTTSAAAGRWVAGAFVFLEDSAEWLVSGVTTWVLPLVMLSLVHVFASQVFLRVLAHGWPAAALAYPYLGLLVLSGISWQYLAGDRGRE